LQHYPNWFAAKGASPMNRQDYLLAVLSAGGEQARFSPVQLQKLFFLLDREVPGFVGGPHFSFRPYDYGPFDKAVYHELDSMEPEGFVEQVGDGRYRKYMLTPDGFRRGRIALERLPNELQRYIAALSTWVRSLSFAQLVSEIYRRYPEMRANSVFQ
jgi:hypothetical protein